MSVTQTRETTNKQDRSAPDPDTAAESPADAGSRQLSLDVIFDVLRNRRRRLVMKAVEAEDGRTTLSDLAEHIGGIENDKPPSALNAQERKRVYVGLYQCHLPRMDDAGAIEFDKNRGTVERGPMADAYLTYLEQEAEEPDRQWPKYYSALAGVSFAAFLVSWLLSAGMETPVLALSILLILGLSGYHWFDQQTE